MRLPIKRKLPPVRPAYYGHVQSIELALWDQVPKEIRDAIRRTNQVFDTREILKELKYYPGSITPSDIARAGRDFTRYVARTAWSRDHPQATGEIK